MEFEAANIINEHLKPILKNVEIYESYNEDIMKLK